MNKPMSAAIASARAGIRHGHGGPFGACIVWRGKIVAAAHNTVLRDRDPTCHAEMNAIRQACRKLRTHDLSGCVIYTTAEPCPMCLGAIYWARLSGLRIGVPARVAAAAGFADAWILEELKRPAARRRIPTRAGIRAAACRKVFREWTRLNGKLY
jgi:tRNA(Arg) A34 adenosine deaminase TadA